jgi:hypothetical protein
MDAIKATVRAGRVDIPVPSDWPDGTEVEIHLLGHADPKQDDGPMTPEAGAAIAPGIRRSQEALRQALPQLLAQPKLRGQWVCYAGGDRIGIAPTMAALVRACLKRGLDDDAFYVGKIEPDELIEEEELGPPSPSLLVDEPES